MSAPIPKVDKVRAAMRSGDWQAAILAAAKFPALGDERNAILSGREAVLRPQFQLQLGKDPAQLIEAAKSALERRYGRV